eukprot:12340356-Alexandrium_andersonii.AAC.1
MNFERCGDTVRGPSNDRGRVMQCRDQSSLQPLLDSVLVERIAQGIGLLLLGEAKRPKILSQTDSTCPLADVGWSQAESGG